MKRVDVDVVDDCIDGVVIGGVDGGVVDVDVVDVGVVDFGVVDVCIDGIFYTVKITWVILWQSRLYRKQTLIIKELLPQRRRRSITMISYGMCILLIRLFMVLLEP